MHVAVIVVVLVSALSCASAQPKAPVDKPQSLRSEKQYEAMEKAIAPYVARARATYPAAKKRFLAGLPPNYLFTVWLRFDERDNKTAQYRSEYLPITQTRSSAICIYHRRINHEEAWPADHVSHYLT